VPISLVARIGRVSGYLNDIATAAADRRAYPGELAAPHVVRRLADEYRGAAHLLLPSGRRGDPLSRAPYRFAAIHAIELYLNAFLLKQSIEPSVVRRMQHDLSARTTLAIDSGLRLRKRTEAHLHDMTGNREYLVTRYGPELTATMSQINRLTATLDEVAKKVTAAVPNPAGPAGATSATRNTQGERATG